MASHSSPVFIVGMARSGTSLLYRVLSSHSHFYSATGASRETKIFRYSRQIHHGLRDERLRLFMGDDDVYRRFVHTVRPVGYLQRLLRQMPRYGALCTHYPLFWSAVGGRYIVSQFFRHTAQARGTDRIVEKTPAHLHSISHIHHTFPDAKVLMMARHPVDVLTSYRRRLQDEFDAGNGYREWLDISMGEFARRFQRDTRTILNWLDTEACRLVRYENFVRDTQSSFQSVCSFLGIPFEVESLEMSRPSKKIPHDPYLSKSITENTKDWRDYMSSVEAQWLEQKVAPFMDALGYASKSEG